MVALVVGLCSVERLDCIGYRRLGLDSGQAPAISGLCEAVISGGNHWNSAVLCVRSMMPDEPEALVRWCLVD